MTDIFVSPVRWRTGHCHWLRRLTRQLKSPKGQHQGTGSNITNYNADLLHAKRTGHRSGDETVVGNRRLHLLESSGTSIAGFSFCRLEEMKLWSLILRAQAWHTRSDDVSDISICRPISDFWNSLPLESIRGLEKGFCMGIFKFSEWDLEQTTTKSTIIVYTSFDSSFAAIYRANTTSDSFVLIIVSHRGRSPLCGRYVFNCGGGGGGGGPGYFRNFLRKKSWPSHFPELINAWPFTNT